MTLSTADFKSSRTSGPGTRRLQRSAARRFHHRARDRLNATERREALSYQIGDSLERNRERLTGQLFVIILPKQMSRSILDHRRQPLDAHRLNRLSAWKGQLLS